MDGGYPHPYSVRKFLVFMRLQRGCAVKVFLSLALAAESSCERTYGSDMGPFSNCCLANLNLLGRIEVDSNEVWSIVWSGHCSETIVRRRREMICKRQGSGNRSGSEVTG